MKSVRSTMSYRTSRHSIAGDKKRRISASESQIDASSYALPPWPEWSDADLNNEKWTVPHSASPKVVDKRRASATPALSMLSFQDPMGHAQLPPSLEADSWVRVGSLSNMKVYDESTAEARMLDLTQPNTHLLRSEVMRWIIASITSLYQVGRTENPELEGQGTDFAISARSWKPWHHIYALCKVTKGATHKPLFNPSGKYVVRLFYTGCWRRITVDDYIPLDFERRPLLPLTQSGTELWPVLLTKALLKIASLSWNAQAEIRDFSVIGSLTGWHAQELPLHEVPPRIIWWLCHKLLTGSSDDPDVRFVGVRETVVSTAYETCRRYSHGPSETPSFGSDLTDPNAEVIGSVVMCAAVETEGDPDEYPDHPILLTRAQIFLQADEDRPPTPVWKTFRWKKWAIDQGLILDDSEKFIKGVRIFSPIEKITPDITRLIPKPKLPVTEESSENDKKKLKKGQVEIKPPEQVDTAEAIYPEYWVQFENLVRLLKRFRIYYTTSAFEHNIKVTDIYTLIAEKSTALPNSPKKVSSRDLKAHSSVSLLETTLKKSPPILYLMIDSMSCKKLLITFSVSKPFSAANLECLNSSRTSLDGGPNTIPCYILGEEYDWKANNVGEIKFGMKTVGTTSQLFQFGEGLMVFRLWIKVPDVYALKISSQTPFLLGTREQIQGSLDGDSESWLSYGANFSYAFNKLMKIDVNADVHLELLENLHKSYLPPSIPKPFQKLASKMKRIVHANFENALIEFLLENTACTEKILKIVQHWRLLFVNSNFGCKALQGTPAGKLLPCQSEVKPLSIANFTPHGSFTSYSTLARISGNDGLPEDVTVKVSMPGDNPSAVEKGLDLISFDKRSGVNVLRKIFGDDHSILKFYPFRDDDKFLISFIDYTGIAVRNTSCDWVPLLRFEVNTHRNVGDPFWSIYLATPAGSGVLQVVNNDTFEEFPRLFDGIEPSYFPANRHGYTIFAFVFVSDREKKKEFQWKIRIASHFKENLPHICSKNITGNCLEQEPPALSVLHVMGHYIPNKEKIVFKCLLTIKTSQTLSMRCVMSKRTAEFMFRIRDDNERLIKEYTAIGEIVVPVVKLTGRESGGPEYYVIEAQVIRKSWKLSIEEKSIANTLREKGRKKSMMFTRGGIIEKSSSHIASLVKMIRNSVNFEEEDHPSRLQLLPNAPYWSLAVAVDQELSPTVTLAKDHREEERILQLKADWEVVDPGRYKRSYQLRNQFLQNKLYCKTFDDDVKALQSDSKCGIMLQKVSEKESDHVIVFDEKYLINRCSVRSENNSKFEEEYSNIREKFDNIRSRQNLRMQSLSQRMADSRDKSQEMISEAYNGRNDCVSNMIEKIETERKASALEGKKGKESIRNVKK